MEYTVRQLIAEIRDVAEQLDPGKAIGLGLTRLRKAELETLLTSLRTDLQARRDRDARAAKLQAQIAEAAAELDKEVPAGTATLSLADLELVRDTLWEAVEAKRTRLHEQPMAGSPAAIAQAEETPEQLTREEMRDLWDDMGHDPLCEGRVDDDAEQFAAEVDALVARDLRDDSAPDGLVERVQFAAEEDIRAQYAQAINESEVDWASRVVTDPMVAPEARQVAQEILAIEADRIRFETQTTATNIEVSNVAVVVQSGSRLLWGKLINVVNRRTRYLPPLLVTVELESGVRQLVAADDVLAA